MCVPVKVCAASVWPSPAPRQVPTALNSVAESDDTRAGRLLCRYSMQRLSTRPPSVMSAIFMRGDVRRDHASAMNNPKGMYTTKLVTTSLREKLTNHNNNNQTNKPPHNTTHKTNKKNEPYMSS